MNARVQEIASGVYLVQPGLGANVYLVASGRSWVLVDAGWPHQARPIGRAVRAVLGAGEHPAAILLTHLHPDHAGSAAALARQWGVAVHAHARDLPPAAGGVAYTDPIGRALGPLGRRPPGGAVGAARKIVTAIRPDRGVPWLPDWRLVPTPGHTPGHIAIFRPADGVLLTGDAVLTIDLNSLPRLLARGHAPAGPPHVSTADWPAAVRSVAGLVRLRPRVLAPGHGRPMTSGTQEALAALAGRLEAGAHRRPGAPAAAVVGG